MAELGGGAKCLKYTLFFFNLLFFLLGLALFIIAIVVMVQSATTNGVFDMKKYLIGYLVIAILILIIGFFGCCGAVRESRCMLITFLVLLIVILIICLGVQIGLGVGLAWVETHLDEDLVKVTSNYTNNADLKKMWDVVQTKYKCCGAYNYTDWNKPMNGDVPDSCCKASNSSTQLATGCGKGLASKTWTQVNSTIYANGCEQDVKHGLRFLAVGALVVVGILLFLEVIGIILSCCLQRSVGEAESYNRM